MEPSSSTSERDRVVQRSGAVFVLSMCVATVGVVIAFGLAFASCNRALSGILDFEMPNLDGARVKADPIPIPQSSCPYLRLVAVSAAAAGAPWRDSLSESADWNRFSDELSEPLAGFDSALGGAIPNVPNAVATDLRAIRQLVEVGRVELVNGKSVNDYLVDSRVFEGYGKLQHASDLVGNACGFELAPPLPFGQGD